jgi:hypothetical protein
MVSRSEGVALAVTVHQPDERLVEMMAAQLPHLVSRYAAFVAQCSAKTHPLVIRTLEKHGARVQVRRPNQEGIHNIGAIRKQTLRAGLGAGTPFLQLCDFDRAIHWVARYPLELDEIVGEIRDYDLLVLGRTERAWATHPPYQAETEPLFNRVFGLVTGRPWDVGAGSRGFSRRAAEMVLMESKEQSVGTDAEWPLISLARESYRTGYRACEGLEFETADRFGPEIEAAGGYEAWEAQLSADPQQWLFRMELALMIAKAAIKFGQASVSKCQVN